MKFGFDDDGRLTIEEAARLKPYVPRSSKQYSYMTDEEIVAGKGGTLFVDTESYVNYFCICFKDYKTKKIIKLEINSDENVFMDERKLSWIMHNYLTVSFNGLKYDLLVIWYAFKYQITEKIKELTNEIIYGGKFSKVLEKDFDFIIYATQHIDLIEVCPLKGSLKLYGARLHSPRIQDLPFAHNEPLSAEQIELCVDYCINDLDNTELEFENLQEPLKLRNDLSVQYKQNLMSKSDAQIAEAIISSELKELTGSWPKKPKVEARTYKYNIPSYMQFQTSALKRILEIVECTKFETDDYGRLIRESSQKLSVQIGNSVYRMGLGGLHSSEKCVSYKTNDEYELLDRDVASYYPAVILNQKLFPYHLGPAFLTVYQTLVDRRLAAKKAKNISISECLKICINGTFGKTGSPYSVLYSPNITIQITLTGQLALLMMIEKLELEGIQIISANTDGILVYCRKDQKPLYLQIVQMWEQITGFITEESSYQAYYARDVNAYLALKEDGSFKGKNDFYDPWRGKSGKDIYWKFQKNPTVQICCEAIENLIARGTPLIETIKGSHDFTKFVSVSNVTGGAHDEGIYLGKVIRWYYAKNRFAALRYIKNNHMVPETLGAKPAMDMPETFPDDIDYNWYLNKATNMLLDINYYQKSKQISLF